MKIVVLSLMVGVLFSACSNSKKNVDADVKQSSQVVAPKEEDARIISEQLETDTLKGSLKAKAMGSIGHAGIVINYYSPAVRGRVVWGGLVPFDNVWVTGAHRATSIDFNQEVVIGGVAIPPGKYALFTIPGKEEWTFIINKNWNQHLADDYNQKDDIVRIKVKPETGEPNQERLRYVIEQGEDNKGEIVLYWEKSEVSLPVQVLN